MTHESWGSLKVAASLSLLAGCAHGPVQVTPPVVIPVDVVTPIAVGCVPANMAAAPEYPDTDDALRKAADAADRYQLLYAGRKVRSARLIEIEPIIAGCPKATQE